LWSVVVVLAAASCGCGNSAHVTMDGGATGGGPGAGGSAGAPGAGGSAGVRGGAGAGGSAGAPGAGGSAGVRGGPGAGGSAGAPGAGGNAANGGTAGSATCGNVQACGGNLVGTWTLTGLCLSPAALTPDYQNLVCSGLTVTSSNATVFGTLALNSDMSYSLSQSVKLVLTYSFPSSCTGGLTCAAYGPQIQSTLSFTAESITCTGTTTCACTDSHTNQAMDQGTYATSGTGLTLTSEYYGVESGSYCVQGSTLHLSGIDTLHPYTVGQETVAQMQ